MLLTKSIIACTLGWVLMIVVSLVGSTLPIRACNSASTPASDRTVLQNVTVDGLFGTVPSPTKSTCTQPVVQNGLEAITTVCTKFVPATKLTFPCGARAARGTRELDCVRGTLDSRDRNRRRVTGEEASNDLHTVDADVEVQEHRRVVDGVPSLVQAGRAEVIGEDDRRDITLACITEDHEGVVATIANHDRGERRADVESSGAQTVAEAVNAGRVRTTGSDVGVVGRNGDIYTLAEAKVINELDAIEVNVDRTASPDLAGR